MTTRLVNIPAWFVVSKRGQHGFCESCKQRVLWFFAVLALATTVVSGVGCNKAISYQGRVKTALEQADLKDVTVSEIQQEHVTLEVPCTLLTRRSRGQRCAFHAVREWWRTNQRGTSGSESDSARWNRTRRWIESNFKAALISKDLDNQHIRYNAKNGVLTLKVR